MVESDLGVFTKQMDQARQQVREMQQEVDREMMRTLSKVSAALSLVRGWFGLFARAIRSTIGITDQLTDIILDLTDILFDFMLSALQTAITAAANPVLGAALLTLAGVATILRLQQSYAYQTQMGELRQQLGIAAGSVDQLANTLNFTHRIG